MFRKFVSIVTLISFTFGSNYILPIIIGALLLSAPSQTSAQGYGGPDITFEPFDLHSLDTYFRAAESATTEAQWQIYTEGGLNRIREEWLEEAEALIEKKALEKAHSIIEEYLPDSTQQRTTAEWETALEQAIEEGRIKVEGGKLHAIIDGGDYEEKLKAEYLDETRVAGKPLGKALAQWEEDASSAIERARIDFLEKKASLDLPKFDESDLAEAIEFANENAKTETQWLEIVENGSGEIPGMGKLLAKWEEMAESIKSARLSQFQGDDPQTYASQIDRVIAARRQELIEEGSRFVEKAKVNWHAGRMMAGSITLAEKLTEYDFRRDSIFDELGNVLGREDADDLEEWEEAAEAKAFQIRSARRTAIQSLTITGAENQEQIDAVIEASDSRWQRSYDLARNEARTSWLAQKLAVAIAGFPEEEIEKICESARRTSLTLKEWDEAVRLGVERIFATWEDEQSYVIEQRYGELLAKSPEQTELDESRVTSLDDEYRAILEDALQSTLYVQMAEEAYNEAEKAYRRALVDWTSGTISYAEFKGIEEQYYRAAAEYGRVAEGENEGAISYLEGEYAEIKDLFDTGKPGNILESLETARRNLAESRHKLETGRSEISEAEREYSATLRAAEEKENLISKIQARIDTADHIFEIHDITLEEAGEIASAYDALKARESQLSTALDELSQISSTYNERFSSLWDAMAGFDGGRGYLEYLIQRSKMIPPDSPEYQILEDRIYSVGDLYSSEFEGSVAWLYEERMKYLELTGQTEGEEYKTISSIYEGARSAYETAKTEFEGVEGEYISKFGEYLSKLQEYSEASGAIRALEGNHGLSPDESATVASFYADRSTALPEIAEAQAMLSKYTKPDGLISKANSLLQDAISRFGESKVGEYREAKERLEEARRDLEAGRITQSDYDGIESECEALRADAAKTYLGSYEIALEELEKTAMDYIGAVERLNSIRANLSLLSDDARRSQLVDEIDGDYALADIALGRLRETLDELNLDGSAAKYSKAREAYEKALGNAEDGTGYAGALARYQTIQAELQIASNTLGARWGALNEACRSVLDAKDVWNGLLKEAEGIYGEALEQEFSRLIAEDPQRGPLYAAERARDDFLAADPRIAQAEEARQKVVDKYKSPEMWGDAEGRAKSAYDAEIEPFYRSKAGEIGAPFEEIKAKFEEGLSAYEAVWQVYEDARRAYNDAMSAELEEGDYYSLFLPKYLEAESERNKALKDGKTEDEADAIYRNFMDGFFAKLSAEEGTIFYGKDIVNLATAAEGAYLAKDIWDAIGLAPARVEEFVEDIIPQKAESDFDAVLERAYGENPSEVAYHEEFLPEHFKAKERYDAIMTSYVEAYIREANAEYNKIAAPALEDAQKIYSATYLSKYDETYTLAKLYADGVRREFLGENEGIRQNYEAALLAYDCGMEALEAAEIEKTNAEGALLNNIDSTLKWILTESAEWAREEYEWIKALYDGNSSKYPESAMGAYKSQDEIVREKQDEFDGARLALYGGADVLEEAKVRLRAAQIAVEAGLPGAEAILIEAQAKLNDAQRVYNERYAGSAQGVLDSATQALQAAEIALDDSQREFELAQRAYDITDEAYDRVHTEFTSKITYRDLLSLVSQRYQSARNELESAELALAKGEMTKADYDATKSKYDSAKARMEEILEAFGAPTPYDVQLARILSDETVDEARDAYDDAVRKRDEIATNPIERALEFSRDFKTEASNIANRFDASDKALRSLLYSLEDMKEASDELPDSLGGGLGFAKKISNPYTDDDEESKEKRAKVDEYNLSVDAFLENIDGFRRFKRNFLYFHDDTASDRSEEGYIDPRISELWADYDSREADFAELLRGLDVGDYSPLEEGSPLRDAIDRAKVLKSIAEGLVEMAKGLVEDFKAIFESGAQYSEASLSETQRKVAEKVIALAEAETEAAKKAYFKAVLQRELTRSDVPDFIRNSLSDLKSQMDETLSDLTKVRDRGMRDGFGIPPDSLAPSLTDAYAQYADDPSPENKAKLEGELAKYNIDALEESPHRTYRSGVMDAIGIDPLNTASPDERAVAEALTAYIADPTDGKLNALTNALNILYSSKIAEIENLNIVKDEKGEIVENTWEDYWANEANKVENAFLLYIKARRYAEIEGTESARRGEERALQAYKDAVLNLITSYAGYEASLALGIEAQHSINSIQRELEETKFDERNAQLLDILAKTKAYEDLAEALKFQTEALWSSISAVWETKREELIAKRRIDFVYGRRVDPSIEFQKFDENSLKVAISYADANFGEDPEGWRNHVEREARKLLAMWDADAQEKKERKLEEFDAYLRTDEQRQAFDGEIEKQRQAARAAWINAKDRAIDNAYFGIDENPAPDSPRKIERETIRRQRKLTQDATSDAGVRTEALENVKVALEEGADDWQTAYTELAIAKQNWENEVRKIMYDGERRWNLTLQSFEDKYAEWDLKTDGQIAQARSAKDNFFQDYIYKVNTLVDSLWKGKLEPGLKTLRGDLDAFCWTQNTQVNALPGAYNNYRRAIYDYRTAENIIRKYEAILDWNYRYASFYASHYYKKEREKTVGEGSGKRYTGEWETVKKGRYPGLPGNENGMITVKEERGDYGTGKTDFDMTRYNREKSSWDGTNYYESWSRVTLHTSKYDPKTKKPESMGGGDAWERWRKAIEEYEVKVRQHQADPEKYPKPDPNEDPKLVMPKEIWSAFDSYSGMWYVPKSQTYLKIDPMTGLESEAKTWSLFGVSRSEFESARNNLSSMISQRDNALIAYSTAKTFIDNTILLGENSIIKNFEGILAKLNSPISIPAYDYKGSQLADLSGAHLDLYKSRFEIEYEQAQALVKIAEEHYNSVLREYTEAESALGEAKGTIDAGTKEGKLRIQMAQERFNRADAALREANSALSAARYGGTLDLGYGKIEVIGSATAERRWDEYKDSRNKDGGKIRGAEKDFNSKIDNITQNFTSTNFGGFDEALKKLRDETQDAPDVRLRALRRAIERFHGLVDDNPAGIKSNYNDGIAGESPKPLYDKYKIFDNQVYRKLLSEFNSAVHALISGNVQRQLSELRNAADRQAFLNNLDLTAEIKKAEDEKEIGKIRWENLLSTLLENKRNWQRSMKEKVDAGRDEWRKTEVRFDENRRIWQRLALETEEKVGLIVRAVRDKEKVRESVGKLLENLSREGDRLIELSTRDLPGKISPMPIDPQRILDEEASAINREWDDLIGRITRGLWSLSDRGFEFSGELSLGIDISALVSGMERAAESAKRAVQEMGDDLDALDEAMSDVLLEDQIFDMIDSAVESVRLAEGEALDEFEKSLKDSGYKRVSEYAFVMESTAIGEKDFSNFVVYTPYPVNPDEMREKCNGDIVELGKLLDEWTEGFPDHFENQFKAMGESISEIGRAMASAVKEEIGKQKGNWWDKTFFGNEGFLTGVFNDIGDLFGDDDLGKWLMGDNSILRSNLDVGSKFRMLGSWIDDEFGGNVGNWLFGSGSIAGQTDFNKQFTVGN
ncbi:MAG: hypothetical protein ACUVXI_11235, partial [bacterium]